MAVLDRYARLLGLRAARVPLGMTLLDALAIGMTSLSILLMVQQSRGGFGTAGAVAGAFTLGNGISAGVQGRLMDRHGPSRVLAPASVACAVVLTSLVVLTEASAPDGLLVVTAALGGLCFPQVVAAMRGVWTQLVDARQREPAYALLSLAFEVGVITGPLMVSATLVFASPATAVVMAAVLAGAAGLVFAATGAARRFAPARALSTGLGALGSSGVRTLALVSMAFGVGVAAARVGAPALAIESSAAGSAGVLLAALSAGSLVGGLVYGTRSWALPRRRRLVLLLSACAGMLLLASLATGLVMLGIAMLLIGLLLAPFVITVSSLVDDVIPQGMVTEAFAVTVMANIGGDSLGTTAAGAIVDRTGPAGAFVFGAVAMGLGCVIAQLRQSRLTDAD